MSNIFSSGKLTLSRGGSDQYLLNGVKMLDADNQPIKEAEFESHVSNEVARFINNNYSQIVFLAGAGASITGQQDSQSIRGRSMRELTGIIADALDADEKAFSISQMARYSKYKFIDATSEDFQLENFISAVQSAQPYIAIDKQSKYNKSVSVILETIIRNTSYDYDDRLLKHAQIINILSSRITPPNKLTIATTNYDTLFEEAAARIAYTVMDGFTADIDPHFDPDVFEWNLVKDIPNLATAELEYKKQVINLIKLHGSLTWQFDDEHILRRLPRNLVNSPVMIFPSANKYMQSYTEPYFELFSKFQELINRPNTLLIANGFSFGDTHIAEMVYHAVTHNSGLSLLVSDYSLEGHDARGWKLLEGLKDSGYSIVFLQAVLNKLPRYLEAESNEY